MKELFIVKYTGQFGFIKPWTAVRDAETFSQQFLTPSIVEGMEKKLFPELLKEKGIYKIQRHRLAYEQMTAQQEQIQPRGWNIKSKRAERLKAITVRSVLLNPTLYLAFELEEDAKIALRQHLCLCRNEDIIFPLNIEKVSIEEWEEDEERFAGYELIFEKNENSFLVGYNRFNDAQPMYGWLKTLGNPVKAF